MNTKLNSIFTKFLLLGLGGFFILQSAVAQTDHSSHMMDIAPAKPAACAGSGLECANAATPFFMADSSLLLAWTAGGVVSVAQSGDKGKTFSSPVAIAQHGKSLDSGADARPQIVANSNGQVFLAYAFFKDSNWNAQINTSVSNDGGKIFSTPNSLVNDSSSQRFPSVLVQPDNKIFVAWIDKRLVADAKKAGQQRLGGSIAYAFSEDGGVTFAPERIANESSCECCRIGVSGDPKGGVGIVYRAIFPGGVRDHASQIITSSGSGQIRRVSNDGWKTDACPHHGPTIAISDSGKIHVAWFTQGSARSGVFYASSVNQGEAYTRPQRIGAVDANISRPYLLAVGKSIWLVWKEFDGVRTSIHLKKSFDDGKTWSVPVMVSSTTGYSDHPLLLNQDDEVYLSWLTREDGYQLIPLNSR
ncbi:glycosyl hydrolase [Polynucleobacter tropicus]|uniref:Glycosyl hydrolase n=1 Tax=Polynucleobacter tropicus TaxID=1743174 RepID=A0A6M9PYS2_9BURK|nr:sialidase family protein [Polynucleobacter tropicus]QKM64468.1 glycosyl hydrolase [Polynucleobacter tropicus]